MGHPYESVADAEHLAADPAAKLLHGELGPRALADSELDALRQLGEAPPVLDPKGPVRAETADLDGVPRPEHFEAVVGTAGLGKELAEDDRVRAVPVGPEGRVGLLLAAVVFHTHD